MDGIRSLFRVSRPKGSNDFDDDDDDNDDDDDDDNDDIDQVDDGIEQLSVLLLCGHHPSASQQIGSLSNNNGDGYEYVT